MATLKNTRIDDTGYLRLPRGTTGQRPSSPNVGYIRWNTTLQAVEVYNGTEWLLLTVSNASANNNYVIASQNYFLNDGSGVFTGSTFTTSAWFRNDATLKSHHLFSFGRDDFDNRNCGYAFYYSSLNRIQISARDQNGFRVLRKEYALHDNSSVTGINSATSGWSVNQRGFVDNNQFSHIVMTWDFNQTNPNSVFRVYWNGQELTAVALSEGSANLSGQIYSSKHVLGKVIYSAASTADKFTGAIDNYSFWPHAFSEAEVNALYQQGNTYTGQNFSHLGSSYTAIAANGFENSFTSQAYNRPTSGDFTSYSTPVSFGSY